MVNSNSWSTDVDILVVLGQSEIVGRLSSIACRSFTCDDDLVGQRIEFANAGVCLQHGTSRNTTASEKSNIFCIKLTSDAPARNIIDDIRNRATHMLYLADK